MRSTLNQIKASESNKFQQVFGLVKEATTQIRGEQVRYRKFNNYNKPPENE